MGVPEATPADALQRLMDDLAIRNLVARLAHLADTSGADELDEYMALFTEDAQWGPVGDERRGWSDILQGAQERRRGGYMGPGTNTRHIVTTQAIQFDGPDTAVSDAYYMVVGDTDASPTIRSTGRYHDLLRREGETWKIASRQITFG